MSGVIRFPDLLRKALIVRGAGEQEAAYMAASVVSILGIDIERHPTGGIPLDAFFAFAKAISAEGPENDRAAGELVNFTVLGLRKLHGITIDEMLQALAKFHHN